MCTQGLGQYETASLKASLNNAHRPFFLATNRAQGKHRRRAYTSIKADYSLRLHRYKLIEIFTAHAELQKKLLFLKSCQSRNHQPSGCTSPPNNE
jgi:hypothetical protein